MISKFTWTIFCGLAGKCLRGRVLERGLATQNTQRDYEIFVEDEFEVDLMCKERRVSVWWLKKQREEGVKVKNWCFLDFDFDLNYKQKWKYNKRLKTHMKIYIHCLLYILLKITLKRLPLKNDNL